MLNWEAIGAVGEILGAIAVLLTLVYLSIQVSDAKKAIRRQASNDVNNLFNATHLTMASSPDLAEAMAKAEVGEELSRAEYYYVRAMFMAQMNAFENLYVHAKEAGNFLALSEVHGMVVVFLEEPWIDTYWEDYGVYFSQEFRRFVADKDSA